MIQLGCTRRFTIEGMMLRKKKSQKLKYHQQVLSSDAIMLKPLPEDEGYWGEKRNLWTNKSKPKAASHQL